MGVDDKGALITDGRFSGASRGAAIGHISPEAAARGPIAAIRDGDMIEIDIPARRLTLDLPEDEIARRLAALPEFEPKIKSGYLKRYARLVTSASSGAVFEGLVAVPPPGQRRFRRARRKGMRLNGAQDTLGKHGA
jgi:dihydroxy-acid dehydratase